MSVQPYSPDSDLSLDESLEELVSAEDFLEFFAIPFEQKVVHVNRLHIMQRYHDYLGKAGDLETLADEARAAVYRQLLGRAYQDFVDSDAQTEKVFKVFRMHEPQTTFVPLDQLLG
ncbi:nitrogenase-stabilizing/protective protein NifW [Pseudomonas oryzae]|uniref:Nitrogenase-stabilizing/protective protein NifW n=1 Tax=Pseudomonas oryzae TaxID=1392877 RepID=A0A1H1LTK6_9PSED|nr:nitrogenase-stabilizing/protective protein NifW [Pseudomonas oryzae]SDR77954.1 nitrogenase-stabilizing/protective protein [Pseudomonas oryzae]